MKKNIYKLMVAALLLTSTTACDKTFDELASNPNQQDVNGFYSSPEKIDQGVIGIYAYNYPSCNGYCGALAYQSR